MGTQSRRLLADQARASPETCLLSVSMHPGLADHALDLSRSSIRAWVRGDVRLLWRRLVARCFPI